MKIAFNYIQSGGVYWYLKGLMNAFASSGHEVFFIPADPNTSILDQMSQIESDGKPIDLFVGSAYPSMLTRATKKGIKSRPRMKVALYAPAHPLSEVGVIAPKRPDLIYDVADESTIKNLEDISKRISLLFIHHHKDCAKGYLEGWENHVDKWCGVGMGCDIVEYRKGNFREEFACDVSIISNYWNYKGVRLRKWLYPLASQVNLKIWGGSPHPIINYLGAIQESEASDIWASSVVNAQIHEQQSELGYECSERTFKVIGTGNFLISDWVDALTKHYFHDDEIVTARTPEEYREKVLHYLANQDQRQAYIERGRIRCLTDHTYHDRAAQMLADLGYGLNSIESIYEAKKRTLEAKF